MEPLDLAHGLGAARQPSRAGRVYTAWTDPRRYPALLAPCAGSVAAFQRGHHATLLVETQVDGPYGGIAASEPTVRRVNVSTVMDNAALRLLGRRLSFHLSGDSGLRDSMRELLPRDEQFRQAFDRFEYFLGLVHVDLQIQAGRNRWGPIGQFSGNRGADHPEFALAVQAEARTAGEGWGAVQGELFGGSLQRFTAVEDA